MLTLSPARFRNHTVGQILHSSWIFDALFSYWFLFISKFCVFWCMSLFISQYVVLHLHPCRPWFWQCFVGRWNILLLLELVLLMFILSSTGLLSFRFWLNFVLVELCSVSIDVDCVTEVHWMPHYLIFVDIFTPHIQQKGIRRETVLRYSSFHLEFIWLLELVNRSARGSGICVS